MTTTQGKIVEALGITTIICIILVVLIYGCLLLGNGTNHVLGCLIVGVVLFVGIFAAVYFGKN